MAQKVTSTDIKLALKEFHNGKPSYFITECKTCSTYFPDPQGLLKFDGLAITKSYTKPNIIGYEIKVSRNDFLQDNKWHLYLQYCNEFYFVVPKGLVKKEDLWEYGGVRLEEERQNNMSLRVKAGIDLEELKKYGFKTGKEWADAGERCLEGIGYKYQHEWYHKFLMDADEPSKIAYIAEDYDIPCVQISVRTEHRDLYVEVAVEGTYHVGGSELDIVTDTIYELTQAGILEVVPDER